MMSQPVRPASGLFSDPRQIESIGDLLANFWQVCYVTPDLDRAMEELGDRLGITNFTEVPVDGAKFFKGGSEEGGEQVPWEPRVAMGARGGPIVELIEPVSGEVDFYRRFLPEDGGVRFHHLAVLLPLGDEAWESAGTLLAGEGLPVEYTIVIPDRARLGYVDTTALLGHYLEICQLEPADTEFFSRLIADGA
jgi:hypothetical protein